MDMFLASSAPLWWVQTKFGSLVLSMTFLTWGLVIINLFLLTLIMVHHLFKKPKEKTKSK